MLACLDAEDNVWSVHWVYAVGLRSVERDNMVTKFCLAYKLPILRVSIQTWSSEPPEIMNRLQLQYHMYLYTIMHLKHLRI